MDATAPQKCPVGTELRARFFALSAGGASENSGVAEVSEVSEADVARYRELVDATDTEPAAVVDGLAISWHPTVRFKQVRFVDAERIDAGVRELFARPSEAAPYLAAAFVDPRELSFRNFENILPLDHLFEDVLGAGAEPGPALTDRRELAEDAYTFTLRLPDAARARLEGLDALDLYVPPLNAATRGGDRFIFHSALLADRLTEAVAAALPEALRDGFSHVNPVFRCNRFEPGDSNFHRHRDTPYYDRGRGHVSRHTLLIYLTGGSALDLHDGPSLADIAPFTCVVFDQRHEHEGSPYRDGRKVFLRTELVYTDDTLEDAPEIGALFGQACYWTGESVFAPELARYADACYNRVAAAHWSGDLAPAAARRPFVHKEFRGVHFVANGYDFWFTKNDKLTLAECAAITLLDYFNCKIGGTAFHTLCDTEVIEADGTDWIPAFLQAAHGTAGEHGGAGGYGEAIVGSVDKFLFFPEPEEPGDANAPDGACCSFHSGSLVEGEASRDSEVVYLYERAQTFAQAHIGPAPVLMLGEDVVIDPDKFLVRGDLIHVLGKESLTPVNFASCQSGFEMPEEFIGVAADVGVAHFHVPPIVFTESADCYHLKFDFFRNSWMVRHQQSTVPVPMITEFELDLDDDEDGEARSWLNDVPASLVFDAEDRPQVDLWWAADTDAPDELKENVFDRDDEEEEEEEEEEEKGE